MLYFVGDLFLKTDDYDYTLARYISEELAMEYSINKVELEDYPKFSFIISHNKDIKKEDCFNLNFKTDKEDIYDIAFDVLKEIDKFKTNDYDFLSKIYDNMQNRIDYEMYSNIFNNYLKKGSFLELGAGSGNVTSLLKNYDLDILASDLNPNLLSILEDKLNIKTQIIDITKFNLNEKFDYIGMFLDTLNYINPLYLIDVFENISKHLNDGGIFMFDIHDVKMLELFDEYSEELDFGEFKFHWLSKRNDNIEVEHIFSFINDNLVIEKHKQFILPLMSYQNIYKDYFKELYVKENDNRITIVLEKKK